MIKKEIVDKISKYFKLTQFEAEKIYDDIFQSIMQGVKEDNIADVTNLGEFIIKYNSNSDENNKKTVEFLPTLSLEEEVNQRSFEEQRSFTPPPVEALGTQQVTKSAETVPSETSGSKNEIEDEIKRKREEILGRITTPKEEAKPFEEIKETYIPPVAAPVIPVSNEIKEEIYSKTEEKPQVEETHEKSFSDYFTEVKKENVSESLNKNVTPPVENVIPPSAVELHNQITGETPNKNINYQPPAPQQTYANGNGNGNGSGTEHYGQDNSYYIWYKDSEPNVSDTQTMSYEYELLYQATKEAEYKSKLRIYVTTFILFFSVVLLLLILSPVFYKYFFTPAEEQKTEEVQQETGSNGIEPSQDNQSSNQSSVNSAQDNNTQTQNNQQPADQKNMQPQTNNQILAQEQPKQEPSKQEQPKQEQPKQEQPKQEQPKQEQPKQQVTQQQNSQQQNTQQQNPAGVTKNAMGWMDEKNKVIYVQLDNGKFTIQESAWDSDAKANKRIGIVGGMVPGLKGNVVKVDLGTKGTWYRARFGEFSTLEEAKVKAEELRNKERTKLHAMLLTFLLFT